VADHSDGTSSNVDGAKSSNKRRSRYKQDNSGGYGNPPVSGQFKRNNKLGGRTKGVTNLETELRKLFSRKIAVKTGGDPIWMLPHQILAKRIMEALLAEKSSPAMIEYARKLFDEFGPKEQQTFKKRLEAAQLSREEQDILSGLLGRALKQAPSEDYISALGEHYNRYVTGIYKVSRRNDGQLKMARISPHNEP